MLENFKESKFAKKCKELSKNGGVVVTFVCLLLALTVILSVTIATNRAKQQYEEEASKKPQGNQTTQTPENDGTEGTVNAPSHNETESRPTSAEVEEFELSLPASGVIVKGHDATIQVWSETMGDYRVHLGVDIQTAEGAPVYAAADGKVTKVWDDALMGRCVAIAHEGETYTFYKNLDKTLADNIKEGQTVTAGQQIGRVGNTAISELADEPHLHLEMTVKGLAVDPRDYFSDEAKQSLQQGGNYEDSADK